VACVIQLYREVRIMKMLDHPNIGQCLCTLVLVVCSNTHIVVYTVESAE